MEKREKSQKKRLVYVLPEASGKTHMKYNVEFITALAKEKSVDIFLVLERGAVGNVNEYLEKIKVETGVSHIRYTGTGIWRIPKLKIYLLEAMFRGYKKVYVHYSFVAAIYASLNPLFTIYYWNCGIPWKYVRPAFQEFYESLSYKLIDYFVTGAEVLTSKYSEFYKFDHKKSIVIPNWIDIKKFREIFDSASKPENREKILKELNINPNRKVLFFNQRLAERKGAHYIPQILESVGENVVMMITNDGPYKEKLVEELKEKNLYEQARFLGRVPNEKVIELLSITDIYVLPSEEEGMSHSLMEAMAASVPAVSYDVGGTSSMYPDNYKDFVVKEKDIVQFNKQVLNLLVDEQKRKQLGYALYEKVKEYDKEIVLERFINKVL